MVVGSWMSGSGDTVTLNASKVIVYVELSGTAARLAAVTTSHTPAVGPVVRTRESEPGAVVKPIAWLAAVSGTPYGCRAVALTRPMFVTPRAMRIAVAPGGTSKKAFG